MPINYESETLWPPAECADAQPLYREWLTWWRGKPEELQTFYQGRSLMSDPFAPPSRRPGGIVGVWNRMWYGRGSVGGVTRLHVPAARDVSAISAALLFADPPALVVPKETRSGSGLLVAADPAQERLDDVLESAGVYSLLHEAAAMDSAAGGVYVRLSADTTRADVPIGEAILPDRAVPEWYGPFLTAVTFWRQVGPERGPVVRHLERHEMVRGVCVITHAVFEGSPAKLGRRQSLADYAETEYFAGLVDAEGQVAVGTSKLDVVYVPNMRPNPLLRGSPLGISDYSGAEGEMDALDETMASLIRDIRLGKGRLIVPKAYVRRGAAGEGGAFDAEQEIFTTVHANPGDQTSNQLAMTSAQFQIRVDQHLGTAAELWRVILKNAGLDGTENDATVGPETATKTNDKASRKRGTRAVKTRYWTPALQQIGLVLLELSALYFGGPPARPVKIEWPDAAAPDMETLARTVQLFDAAGAVSTQTKVEMVHPDWDEERVAAEVLRISGDAPEPPDQFDPGAGEPVDAQPVDEGVDNAPQDRA